MRTRCHFCTLYPSRPTPITDLVSPIPRKVRLPTRIEPRTTSIPLGASPFSFRHSASPRALGVYTQYSYDRLRSLRCPFHQGRRDTFPLLTSPIPSRPNHFRERSSASLAIATDINIHHNYHHHRVSTTTLHSDHGYEGCPHALNARVQDNAEGAHTVHCRPPMRDQHTRVCPPTPPLSCRCGLRVWRRLDVTDRIPQSGGTT